MSKDKIKKIYTKIKQEVIFSDPAPVLSSLGIHYKSSPRRYVFKAREERTPSANLFEDGSGKWIFKDFGFEGQGNNIVDVVMLFSNSDFKEALLYCADTLKVSSYKELNSYQSEKQDKERAFKKLQDKAKQVALNIGNNDDYDYSNKTDSTFSLELISKKTYFSFDSLKKSMEYTQNSYILKKLEDLIDYIEYRKFDDFKMLEVYYTKSKYINKDGEEKQFSRFMLGLPYSFRYQFLPKEQLNSIDKTCGVELRVPQLDAKIKTFSYLPDGEKKTSTFLLSNKQKKLMVFESVFDYLSIQPEINISDTDVAILNGVGMVKHFLNNMKAVKEYSHPNYEDIYFLKQNDTPGEIAVLKMLPFFKENFSFANFHTMAYAKDEYKYDLNDLKCKSNLSANEIVKNRIVPYNNFFKDSSIIQEIEEEEQQRKEEIFEMLVDGSRDTNKTLSEYVSFLAEPKKNENDSSLEVHNKPRRPR